MSQKPKRFRNRHELHKHSTATEIRNYVGERVWQAYFKFTLERNPFEKILTKYWSYAGVPPRRFYKQIPQSIWGEPLSFAGWFRLHVWSGRLFRFGRIPFPRHYHCYTDHDEVIVDFVGRFENRETHLTMIGDRLGLSFDPEFHVGNSHRKERRNYVDYYDPWMRKVVETYFQPDLSFLGYRFGESDRKDAVWDREKLSDTIQRPTKRAG